MGGRAWSWCEPRQGRRRGSRLRPMGLRVLSCVPAVDGELLREPRCTRCIRGWARLRRRHGGIHAGPVRAVGRSARQPQPEEGGTSDRCGTDSIPCHQTRLASAPFGQHGRHIRSRWFGSYGSTTHAYSKSGPDHCW